MSLVHFVLVIERYLITNISILLNHIWTFVFLDHLSALRENLIGILEETE